MISAVRMLVVWCPDWPVVAWGIPLDEPSVVVVANRVVATSPAARAEGVAIGHRRREAQGRCPDVAVLQRDHDREARLFEPVAAALEELTPRVEVSGPGLVGFPTRGPSRFFGGDEQLACRVVELVDPVVAGRCEVRIGVADGVFAARLAAHDTRARSEPVVIPVGSSPAFLAPHSVHTLGMLELTEVLARLGLDTLGDLAALDPAAVVGRFGREGQIAHRLARGDDEHPPDLRRPAHDLAVTWMFEPPADRIDRCAFAAKALADELHAALLSDGLACTRVAIEAETEDGDQHSRLWRHEGALSASALAERARWQLDGWLQQSTLTSGIARLTLIPDEVVPATGRQLGLWGGRAERADDVTRVVARLQATLGAEAITVPERRGGRGPGDRIALIPAAAVDLGEPRSATEPGWVTEPWPGGVPAPSPERVLADPVPVDVLDVFSEPVGVSGRGELTADPALVALAGHRSMARVTAWAGPWPADERWWDPDSHRRRARLQVALDDGSAHLLTIEHTTWWLEATY